MYTAFTYGSVTENKFFQKITNKQKSLHKTCDNAQIFNNYAKYLIITHLYLIFNFFYKISNYYLFS